jgi:hypothetical protein
MTKHLTDREIIAAADGALADDQQRHTETCEACTAAVLACQRALEDTRAAGGVPEPSPLFWDHFSARVRAATDAQPVPSAGGWMAWWRPLLVGAAMVAGAVAGVQWLGPDEPAAPVVAEHQAPPVETTPIDEPPTADDSDWDAVAAMASALDASAVESIAPAPVAATPLIEDLTSRELQEFARLLRAEMGGVQ